MERELPINLPDDCVIIRLPEVLRMTGLSKSTIRRLIMSGDFPKAVPLMGASHPKAPVGYVLAEVKVWVKQRIAMRD